MNTTGLFRSSLFAVLLMLGLLTVTAWSYGRLVDRHAAAVTAARDLETCSRLADQIRDLGHRGASDPSGHGQLRELTGLIERSTRSARIPPGSLVRIWPDPPARVGDTPYEKRATQVLFRQVTLRQWITFLHAIASQDGGASPTRIRLLSPEDEGSDDRWTAEVTLTQLVYSPGMDDDTHR